MVTTGASVEWTVVSNEVEALQLEYSWIKEFDPRFNVKYRDDKSYPYLAVTMGEEFPRAQVLRGAKRKGTRYFGPYAHAWAIRETLDLLLRVFPMRTCSSGVFKRAGQVGRPCLLGYIDKCSAPCVGRVDADEHRAIAEDFCDFMAGNTGKFVKRLERRMKDAAARDGLRAGGPAARRHRRAATARWRSPRSSSPTPPTPTSSPSPRTSSRPPSRSSTSAAAGCAASAAGWSRRRPRTPARWSSTFSSRCTAASRPRACRARCSCRSCRPTPTCSPVAQRAARGPGRPAGAAARRQEGADGDGAPQRRAVAGAAQGRPCGGPDRPQPGPPGAAGHPGDGRCPAADRVLRRQPRPGHQRRRVDGGLRGRPAAQVRVPPVHRPRHGRRAGRGAHRRHRGDARGAHPPVPPLPRRPGRRDRHRGGRQRRTGRRRP